MAKLKIHSENILPIIKQWLYSERDIFVRELVSNACDACHKMTVLADKGETKFDDELKVDITVNKEAKTLVFSDTGLGMTADEVKEYIAQLAFSGAEDFVKNYGTDDEKDQIIGHFGLGFYSAFMVADKVEIDTLSYKEGSEPALWTCDGSSEYTLKKGKRSTRGTTITLHLGDEHGEYLEDGHLTTILRHYCSFLPFPIHIGQTQINEKPPLWAKAPSECTKQEYIDFYHQLYPFEPEPLFWIHLNVDFPFHLKGILYFPHVRKDFDFSKNTIKLYCNRVFVSDNCKDLIPEYLTVLQGAIDSPDIPLNVSRSYLQMDKTVRQLAGHISKKVSDRLSTFYKSERESYLSAWSDLELIVKLGCLQDDKFYERVKECLLWKNTDGEWTTIEEALERRPGKVFYAGDERYQSHVLDLYKAKGIEVLFTQGAIDTHLIAFLERKLGEVKFQRIDGAVDEAIVDKEKEKTLLDADGKSVAHKLAELIKANLDVEEVEVEAQSLATTAMPGFVMIDEETRRLRDYMAMSGKGEVPFSGTKKFIVNTNSPLIEAIERLSKKDATLAKELTRQIYDLSLLGQREMDPKTLDEFIKRNNAILEKLALEASGT